MLQNRQIFLPLEVFAREYLGKLALSVELLKSHFEVVIGHNHTVRALALEAKKESVFYEIKGESTLNMPHLSELKKKSVCLVGQDEEAGISYSNFDDFRKFRPEVDNIQKFDHFFLWGEDDLSFYRTSSNHTNLQATGSPRSIFWGDFGTKFYEARELQDKRIRGKYLLIVTNFGAVNPIGDKREARRYSQLSGYPDSYNEYMNQRKNWEIHAHKTVVRIINEILASTTYRIVLRPHPVENVSKWENEFSGETRVVISKVDDSIPVILGAEHVLHSGSTAGIESLLCNKSTISYSNIVKSKFFEMVADLFSVAPQSISELIEVLNSGERCLPKHGFEDVIKRKITMNGDVQVLKLQARAISEAQPNCELQTSQSNLEITEKSRKFVDKLTQRFKYGKSSYEVINKSKRPTILIPTVKHDLLRLSRQLDFEPRVDVLEVGESTFRLRVK
jgi:surface carbohydrate biosynthesis protein